MEKGLTRKAELLRGGDICIPEGLELPDLIPGFNGNPDTAVLSFDGFRAKKRIVHGNGEFELRPKDGGYELLRSGEPFLPEVGILRVPHSCPEQAVFNLLPSRHDCFSDGPLTTGSVMEMLDEAMTRGKVKSVAFSGGGSDEEISRLADAISAVREAFPKMTIGVEPLLNDAAQIGVLREAGVNEIKINVKYIRRDTAALLEPDTDYDFAFDMLRASTDYFKKGKMASTIYYGLGETDQDVDMMLEKLCRMNVLPILRMFRFDDSNRSRIEAAGIPTEPPSLLRTMFLAGLQKNAMARHGLNPDRFHTTCFQCECCDLVPFHDF